MVFILDWYGCIRVCGQNANWQNAKWFVGILSGLFIVFFCCHSDKMPNHVDMVRIKRQNKLRRTKCQMKTKKSGQNASKSFGILSFGILSIGILSYHLSKMPTHSKYVDNSWRIFSFVWSKLVICLFKACFAVTLAEALNSFLVSLAKFVVCVCFLFFIDFTFQPPKYVVSPSKTITLTYNWYNLKW